jgi:hypothetical protein
MSCYILKTGVTGVLYATTNDNGRRSVIAFKTKQQAGTYKRLLNEMSSNKTHNNQFKIEHMKVDFMMRTCNVTALDFTLFDEMHSTQVHEAERSVTDDIRFHLENKFRYGV